MTNTIYLVLTNAGDGSSYIRWFRNTTIDELYKLEEDDPNTYSSGDGLQFKKLAFPEGFDLDAFAEQNHIYWEEDEYD